MNGMNCIILKEKLEPLEKKVKQIEDENRGKQIAIWGAGNTAMLFLSAFEYENIEPDVFIDSNPQKIGRRFFGKNVISPDDPCLLGMGVVLICSQNPHMCSEISKVLQKKEIKFLTVNEHIIGHHTSEILQCIDLLEDEVSKDVYSAVVSSWIENKFPSKMYFDRNQYFSLPEFCTLDSNDVFVDVGAFVGDSMEKYIFAHMGVFKKIIAFEPDNRNYAALSARTQRLCTEWALSEEQIELVRAGVGVRTSKAGVIESDIGTASTISGSIADESATESFCEMYAIDEYFSSESVTFLKADIEGHEWDMLLGAENVIRRDVPKLAISIYHNASDLFRIILWLNALQLGYRFSVRHHSPKFEDTVLYAYR